MDTDECKRMKLQAGKHFKYQQYNPHFTEYICILYFQLTNSITINVCISFSSVILQKAEH
jgi:hypothetical protein